MTMRLVRTELVDSREILPGPVAPVVPRPELATGSRAGQFVHARTGDLSGLVLRRPFSINTADPATGVITIHFRTIGRGTEWFTRLRPGDTVDMLGPLGRPFEVDPRSRHLLLIAGGLGMAGVRSLADEAIRDGRQVDAPVRRGVGPRRLPVVAPARRGRVRRSRPTTARSGHPGSSPSSCPSTRRWADQAFACGPAPMLAALARLADRPARAARGREARAQARRRQGGRRSARRPRAARRSSRCRWSRTWAARSGRAWAA